MIHDDKLYEESEDGSKDDKGSRRGSKILDHGELAGLTAGHALEHGKKPCKSSTIQPCTKHHPRQRILWRRRSFRLVASFSSTAQMSHLHQRRRCHLVLCRRAARALVSLE